MHDIYASVERAATLKGWDGVDLLIIGGDFQVLWSPLTIFPSDLTYNQAVRNSNDMACMSVPAKYKEIGDFHEYYSGKRTAPYLTIFIGGNHEASNHLFELYYGGWVAPNIYYMGAANVLRYGPLRIAGLSGIWKGYDYRKPHFERIPYNREELGSIYHVRELDVRKLLQIRTQVDIGLSHDWPKQVEYSGDWQRLFSVKPFLRDDSQAGKLGSEAARFVLDRLRPAYWFSAHLHTNFAAAVQHVQQESQNKYHHGLDGASIASMVLGEDEGDQQPSPSHGGPQSNVHNSDEIDLNLDSDSDKESEKAGKSEQATNENTPTLQAPSEPANATNAPELISAWNNFHHVAAKNEAAETARLLSEQQKSPASNTLDVQHHNLTWRKVDTDEDGLGRKAAGIERTGPRESKKQKVQHETQPSKKSEEVDLSPSGRKEQKNSNSTAESNKVATHSENTISRPPKPSKHQPEVSDDVRNQLPSSFSAPQKSPQISLPFPEKITNKTTNFLALDKCLPNRQFLQLLEIEGVSEKEEAQSQRPFHLHYDPEWLAITRVFAKDLDLGDPNARRPYDLGDVIYKPQIDQEEKWVEEHIVKPGKLAVPENFTQTAPVYDPQVPVTTEAQPPEFNNPQTAAFCELVGIQNKFYLTDEERHARLAAGPRPYQPWGGRRGRGGQGDRGGRGGRGRGSTYGRGFGRGGRRQ